MAFKVYVAGATRNIERAERFIARVKAEPLLENVYDWPADVRAELAQGRTDKMLTAADRALYAQRGLDGVFKADVVVVLAEDPMSPGQSVELGGALLLRMCGSRLEPRIIVSGGNRRSIFTAPGLVDCEVLQDDEAFEILLRLVEKRHTGS